MKIRVGDEVESEFGRGKVVAITRDWLIHEDGFGGEAAFPHVEGGFWIPVTGLEEGSGAQRYHLSEDEIDF